MKFIGFLKEFDKNIKEAKTRDEMMSGKECLSDTREKVIRYLKSGQFVGGAMSYIYDIDREPIGNLNYFTDGQYIWPSYFCYFIEKYPNFLVDSIFINYIKENNYKFEQVSSKRIGEIDYIFSMAWSGKF